MRRLMVWLVAAARAAAALFLALAAGTVLLTCPGCTRASGARPPSLTYVILDGSMSTFDQRTRSAAYFETILASCHPGDILMGDVATADSTATSSLPLNVTFPTMGADTTATQQRQGMAAALSKARQEFKGMLACRSAGSDILGALGFGAKILGGDVGHEVATRRLVYIGDAFQQTERYDFADLKLTKAMSDGIIAAERTAHQLPALGGVTVWFAGVGAKANADPRLPGQRALDPDHLAAVEAFWQAYFKAAGASLPDDHYGPTLVNWPAADAHE